MDPVIRMSAAVVAAGRPAPFIDQHAEIVCSAAEFALDAARLLLLLGLDVDDAFSLVLDLLDDEVLTVGGASALGLAIAAADAAGVECPIAWRAHVERMGLA